MGSGFASSLQALCTEHGLAAVYAFGSRAAEIAARVTGAGDPAPGALAVEVPAHPGSDVDIGVQPLRGNRLSARDRVRLMQGLEILFGVERVDLVVLPEANAFLAADVVRGELLIAPDPDAEAEAQLYYLRRAADLAPYLREQWRQTVGSEL